MTTTPTTGAADLPEALRVPLDSLHADAGYLCGRLLNGSLTQEQVVESIRRRIDAAKLAAITAQAISAEPAEHVQKPAEIEHVTCDVSKNGTESYMSTQPATQQEAQEPCPTCIALARTVMLDQVSFDRKPDCYGIRQITDDEGIEEWEDIRTSPDVAREEANDMMATGRGEIYEVVPLWTTPQPAPATQQVGTDNQPYAIQWDAELGRTAMRFVDRAGDVHPGIDDAETICAEFHAAMSAVIERMPHVQRMSAPQSSPTPQADSQPAPVLDERDDFEKVFPLPSGCIRVGTGYASIGYSNWAAHTHCERWQGWQARAARAPADSVLEDAARLDWLLLRISGAEFRRLGVHYSGNARRADVDAARKQGGKA